MAYPWVIQKVKDLISGLAATNSNVSSNASAISTLTPTPPPVGGIIDYYGSLDNSGKYPMSEDGHINYNWHVCDGTDGTPNLVGKTIIGASKATYGDEGGSDTVTPSVTVNSATQSVSVNGHTLTTAEMPSHTHIPSVPDWGNEPSASSQGWPSDQSHNSFRTTDRARRYAMNAGAIPSTGSSGSHSHGITSSAHNHTVEVGSVSTYQPYKALYKVMRVA